MTDFSIRKLKNSQEHKSKVRTENDKVAQEEWEEDNCGQQAVKIMFWLQMSDDMEKGYRKLTWGSAKENSVTKGQLGTQSVNISGTRNKV